MNKRRDIAKKKLINLLFSITCAGLLIFLFISSLSLLSVNLNTLESISLISESLFGLIKGLTIVMIRRVKIAIVILNGLKIVSVTGIIPILLISEWSAEETNNAADEEYPICQITYPEYADATSKG